MRAAPIRAMVGAGIPMISVEAVSGFAVGFEHHCLNGFTR